MNVAGSRFNLRATKAVDPGKRGEGAFWHKVVPDFEAAFMAIERVEEQLRRFTSAVEAAGIEYAIIGGNAVAAWVSTVDPDATRTTKDVDVLLHRADLERVAQAVAPAGLVREEALGIPIFVERENLSPKRAVQVILADEPVRAGDVRSAPRAFPVSLFRAAGFSPRGFSPLDALRRAVDPVYENGKRYSVTSTRRSPQGFRVIDLPELVRMKLDASRRVDQVHIEDLLRVGLIDAKLAAGLPEDLLERLRYIRDTMEWFTEPPEF